MGGLKVVRKSEIVLENWSGPEIFNGMVNFI